MNNKLQTVFLYITIIFSLTFFLNNIIAIITEVIFSIKNQSLFVLLKASLFVNIFRIFFPILLFMFIMFIKYELKKIEILKNRILSTLFNLIFSISLFSFIIMLQYVINNQDLIAERQTIPFGALNLLTILIFTVLAGPMILIVIPLIILFINIKASKK